MPGAPLRRGIAEKNYPHLCKHDAAIRRAFITRDDTGETLTVRPVTTDDAGTLWHWTKHREARAPNTPATRSALETWLRGLVESQTSLYLVAERERHVTASVRVEQLVTDGWEAQLLPAPGSRVPLVKAKATERGELREAVG